MAITITFEGHSYHAARCKRCGLKMYPAKQLESHKAMHAVIDLMYNGHRRRLVDYFNHMRKLK